MPEYVEKETALAQLMKLACKVDEDKYVWVPRGAVFHMLDDSPAADVAPVRHGRWVPKVHKMSGELPCCSECGWFIAIETRWCPGCGAKMDRGSGK